LYRAAYAAPAPRRMIYVKTISHLSKPIKYQLRVVLFALHRDTPFLLHRLRYKISMRGYFKFHFIAQKTVAREILAAASFKFTLRAASRFVCFDLSLLLFCR